MFRTTNGPIFIGRTDAEAETPILWPPDAKNWLIWKDPDAGEDWRWEEKGTTEDERLSYWTELIVLHILYYWVLEILFSYYASSFIFHFIWFVSCLV